MAIDKMTPRFLVSDEDERLLQAGAMTDALNVTISEDGEGSEGVIKNVKGTIAGTAVSGSALTATNNVTIIGQVSDSQRGYIYFFVADANDTSDGPENAIYRYDTSNNQYKVVFKSGYLDFSTTSFVKADVVNAAFQQDGALQAVLYFTDNEKPPRKINVDRAIAGEYDSISGSDLDYALCAIKAAPTTPPDFSFATEVSIEQNNFQENIFQYATQIIYKDGEESAISSYSKLAISQSSIFSGLENENYGVQNYIQNVCKIRTNIDPSLPDLKKVRILAKKGNDGSFFVVDEFDPKTNINRSVLGSSFEVYNSGTAEYKFFNDRLGAGVSSVTTNKMYDNVPLKARGQAIAGNRLIYSNYTEGRANNPGNTVTDLDVVYSDVGAGSSSLIPLADSDDVISQSSPAPHIDIDLLASNAFGASANNATVIPAGTRIDFSFVFKPTFTVTAANGNLIEFDAVLTSNPVPTQGSLSSTSLNLSTLSSATEVFRFTTFLSSDQTISSFADTFAGLVDEEEITLIYTGVSGALTGSGFNGTNYTEAEVHVTFKLGEVTAATANGEWTLKPRITKIKIESIDFASDDIFSSDHAGNTRFDCLVPSGNVASEVNYTGVNATYISDQLAIAETLGASPTFKSGSSYSLGVVFYDKWGRHGFVNELGSVFVDHIATRSSNYGPASVNVNFANYAYNPSWADSYQIVCTESSVFSVFQYTVGGAYPSRQIDDTTSNPRPLDTTSKKLYISLKTLDLYRNDKDFLRDYSYTKGDKLRIISAKNSNSSAIIYPTASDGTVIEFDVVGVEVLTYGTDNPIHLDGHDGGGSVDSLIDPHSGTFLVVEAPSVAAQVDGTDGNPLEYVGYDWFQVTGENYSSANSVSTRVNYWNRETLVEIVTPKKSTSENIYYEIGERRRLGVWKVPGVGPYGPAFTINSGDVHYRAVACKSPVYSTSWKSMIGGSGTDEVPKSWVYQPKYLEDSSVSDAFASKSWDRGRAHVVYENAAEINRFNGVTYSDAYAEDVANLSLSSFNPSLGNFESLDSRYGAVNYLGNYSDDLVAIQENRFGLVPVGKNIIQYAEGSGNVAISTSVLGKAKYSSGDFGCGNHPEAVLIQDGDVFFVDESRQKVMRLGGGQLTPISDKGMSSAFEDFFKTTYTKYVSGYDPRINTYFITGKNGSTGETIGYDVNRGVWQSKYSFLPDIYASQDNMLYSALYNTNGNAFYRHDDNSATTNRNMFYEASTASPSTVEVVSKVSPSRVKVYNALSYEGDSALWDMNPGAETDLGQTSGAITSWSKREGSYYASMPRDTSSNSTSQKIFLGSLTDTGDGLTFTSTIRLSRQHIPLGSQTITQPSPGDPITLSIDSISGNTITFSEDATGTVGDTYLILDSATNGDPMRGHWAKIKLTNSSNTKHELYCINTHVTDSKSHHPLGQQ